MHAIQATPQVKAGPKKAADSSPLDLSSLPQKRDWRRVKAFIETFLTHPNGKPIKLKPFQLSTIKEIFPTVVSRRPMMGLLSIARGQGKTELASWLAVYALYADDVPAPEVLVVASSLEQAQRQIFARCKRLINANPELAKRAKITSTSIETPWNSGSLHALPATEAGLQGWQHSAAFLDELHVVDSVVWESVVSGSAKREGSLTLAISTPPSNPASVMKILADTAKAEPDPDFYYREWTSDLDHEPLCPCCIKSARPLTYNRKDEGQKLAAMLKKVPEAAFRRLQLGQWDTAIEEQWLTLAQLEPVRSDRVLKPSERVVLAFDGSWNGDCTALVAVTVEGVPHVQPLKWWSPTPGQNVPVGEVEEAIRQAHALYRVEEIICDAFRWQRSIDVLSGDGLPMVAFPQTASRMTPATVALYGAINEQKVTISNDTTTLEHFLNARVKHDDRGTRLAKATQDSGNKIDLAVCAVMGYARASHYANKKETPAVITEWSYV